MKPIELNKKTFEEKVALLSSQEWNYLGDKPALIDFYAVWCGPCKSLAPVLDTLAEDYSGKVAIYKVDVDKERELAGAFGVRSIPTLLFIPVEGDPQILQGALPKHELEKVIDSVLLGK